MILRGGETTARNWRIQITNWPSWHDIVTTWHGIVMARYTCTTHMLTWQDIPHVVSCKHVCRAMMNYVVQCIVWCILVLRETVLLVSCCVCRAMHIVRWWSIHLTTYMARHSMTTSLTKWSAHHTTCMTRYSYDNIIGKMISSSHDMLGTTYLRQHH